MMEGRPIGPSQSESEGTNERFPEITLYNMKKILINILLSVIILHPLYVYALDEKLALQLINDYVSALKSDNRAIIRAAWQKISENPEVIEFMKEHMPYRYQSFQLEVTAITLEDLIDRRRKGPIRNRAEIFVSKFLPETVERPTKVLANGEVVRLFPNQVTFSNGESVLSSPNRVSEDNRYVAINSPNQNLPTNQEIIQSRRQAAFGNIIREYGENPEAE